MRYATRSTPLITSLIAIVFVQSSFAFQGSVPVVRYEHVTILSSTSVRFEAGFSPPDPGTSHWFRWWYQGNVNTFSPRLYSTTDSIVDGIQYVSVVVNSFVPDTTYLFRLTAATMTDTIIGMPMGFRTNHSSFVQFNIVGSSTSVDLSATYVPGNQRSVITIRDVSNTITIGVPIDTIEAGTDEVLISHHVYNLTPSTLYSFVAEVRTIDGAFSASQALRSTMTSYDSTARGLLGTLYLNYTNGRPFSGVVNFGVHTSGSSCLDPLLGEDELPPWPPGGSDARIVGNCLLLGVYHDFHAFYAPSQVDTYRIHIPELYPLRLSWADLKSLYSGTVSLVTQDTTIDMRSVNEYTVENPDISIIRIFAAGPMPRHDLPIIAGRSTKFLDYDPTVNSTIITNGLPTEAWIEWGMTPDYGNETPHLMPANREMVLFLAENLPSFGAETTYYVRTVAKNSSGTYYGNQQSFVFSPTTDVKRAPGLPTTFALEQNYPNPFNPSTKISYAVPKAGLVSIVVYDVLGREVSRLVQEIKPAGEYSVTWNAERAPSGVYFYRLLAGVYSESKKMLLMR